MTARSELLNFREAMDLYEKRDVVRDSVYRWIYSKRLPAHRVGRLWKFKLSQIDQWGMDSGVGDPAFSNGTAP